MSPSKTEFQYQLFESDPDIDQKLIKDQLDTDSCPKNAPTKYKMEIVWRNVLLMSGMHLLALYGVAMFPYVKWATLHWVLALAIASSVGVLCGAHRLWSHRSFKANFGLRLFLSLMHVMALQNDIYEWSRDHRAHHKFSETDGDPHNSSRGFFFSHVGWLLVKKHPDVVRRGKTIDLSDLERDPIVMFQRRHYKWLLLVLWAGLPTLIPVMLWNESLWLSFVVSVAFRWVYAVNVAWCVNSFAHMHGTKPYDTRISPVEATLAPRHLMLGEGFHNYHHTFPWDYSASELGPTNVFNPATAAIHFFAYMGWAWDLKKPTPEMIANRIQSRGNPKHKYKPGAKLWIFEYLTGLALVFLPLACVRVILSWVYGMQ